MTERIASTASTAPSASNTSATTTTATTISSPDNPKRILLIEDNPINQTVLKRFLSAGNYQYDLASNGLAGLNLYNANKYDAILMDIEMPVMDGIQATKRIREVEKKLNRPRVPIICVSGNIRSEHKQNALAVGMAEYINKPFNKEQILSVLKKVLESNITFVETISTADLQSSITPT